MPIRRFAARKGKGKELIDTDVGWGSALATSTKEGIQRPRHEIKNKEPNTGGHKTRATGPCRLWSAKATKATSLVNETARLAASLE
jgi:hypothetical protein